MSAMNYKGYFARVEFDPEDHVFVGRVVGVRDVIGFHGASVEELENAFKEAVDNYLAACKELNQKPNKPYSGKLLLRIPEDLHASVAATAEASGKSVNKWVSGVLKTAVNHA